jgi:hypothetical protein
MSNADWVHLNDCVHNPHRIDYLSCHLPKVERVLDGGVSGSSFAEKGNGLP